MTDFDPLIERYLDDRGSLSGEELRSLVAGLADDPEAAAKLKDDLLLQEQLGQRLAVDRGDFPAQVAQRIRDFEVDHGVAAKPVTDADTEASTAGSEIPQTLLRQQDEARMERWRRRRRRRRIRAGVFLVSALVLVVGFGVTLVVSVLPRVAVVATVRGEPTVIREGEELPLRPGQQLLRNDLVRTAIGESVRLNYPDGTWVEFEESTEATLLQTPHPTWPLLTGKSVLLTVGSLRSEIAPQRERTPMTFRTLSTTATVLGTELKFVTTESGIDTLTVTEGRVMFGPNVTGAGQVLATGETARAHRGHVQVFAAKEPPPGEILIFLHPEDRPVLTRTGAGVLGIAVPKIDGEVFWESDRLAFRGGSLVFSSEDTQTLRSIGENGSFTLEFALRADHRAVSPPRSILTFSESGSDSTAVPLLEFRQQGSRLTCSLRDSDGERRDFSLGDLSDRRWHRIMISFRASGTEVPGELVGLFDGTPVAFDDAEVPTGALVGWTSSEKPIRLRIAPPTARGRWRGDLTRLTITDQFTSSKTLLDRDRAAPALPK